MLKIVAILIVAMVLFRWGFGFWPWDLARGPDAHAQKLGAARRLLGVSKRADRAEILAAHKLLLTRVHPDRGGTVNQVHDANDARDLLLQELGEPPAIDRDVAAGPGDAGQGDAGKRDAGE